MDESTTDRYGPHAGGRGKLLLPVAWSAIAGRLEAIW
jgi:hypothetical protein